MDIGILRKGERVELFYDFTNVGNSDLIIELVTACICADVEWTQEAIPPGGRGSIIAIFDSARKKDVGVYNETIDIISNAESIVTECKFKVEIIK